MKTILDQLESGRSPADQLPALKQLSELSVDGAFAQEFLNQDGLKLISSKIENEAWSVYGDVSSFRTWPHSRGILRTKNCGLGNKVIGLSLGLSVEEKVFENITLIILW